MKTLGLFETKNRLSEVCEQVATTSEPVIITRHRKPLVKIVPIKDPEVCESVWNTVEESRARYGPLEEEIELPTREVSANRSDPFEEG